MTDFKQNPITTLVRKAQDELERRAGSIEHNEAALQQDRFWLRTVTWTLVGTTVFGIGWLGIARTEEVVVAQGQLKPTGGVKEIRIPAGTVVEDILVEQGDQVRKDQVLIRLDQESTEEQLKSIQQTISDKADQNKQKLQQLELKKNERKRTTELNKEHLAITNSKLSLETDIMGRFEALAKEGAVQEIQYLQQRNKVAELKSDVIKIKIDGERQLNQIDQQLEQLNSDLAGIRSEQAQLKAQLTDVQVNQRNQVLRAPVDGTVFDLILTNPGYISSDQSAQAALKIVPLNTLEAEVEIPSSKIGFVRNGQDAEISIDSFPATDFGVISGNVTSVGSDALEPDPQMGKQEYHYPATIKLDEQELRVKNGTALPLQVGMSLTANIKLRSVSYLQLLLNTFRNKTDSLREI